MARSPHPARFPALAVPNYRRFLGAQAVSLVGSWAETIAQGVLILSLTHSPAVLGTAVALRYLPVLVLGPWAGVLVDRHDRRRTLMLTQTALGATSALFGIVVLSGGAAVWQVYAVAAVFGVVSAADNPARMALIPELVGADSLRDAVALNSTVANVGRGVGPVVAAALIGGVGIGWCFIANAVSFGVVVAALTTLDVDRLRPEGTIPRRAGQVRQALRTVRADPQLLGPLLMMVIVGTLTYEFDVSLPVFAERTLAAGPGEYAWLTAAFGAGAVAAGVALICFPQTGLRRMAAIAAAYGVSLALTAAAPDAIAANASVVLVGACSIGFLVTGNTTIQLHAPAQMRGRVTSLWTTAFLGSTPVGALIVGAVAQQWGGRSALAVAALACGLAAGCGWLLSRRRERRGSAGDVTAAG